MRIENEGQLENALRELEGLELHEADHDSGEGDDEDQDEVEVEVEDTVVQWRDEWKDARSRASRKRELELAIAAYNARCFPGCGRQFGP